MDIQAYYSTTTEAEANRRMTDVPLTVNCAGVSVSAEKFRQRRKRRDFYLLYGTGGRMPILINNNCHSLEKDTFIIIEPEVFSDYGLKEGFINYYWVHFTGSYAKELLEKLDISLNRVYSAAFTDDIKKLFESIFGELIFSAPYSEVKLSGLLVDVLTQAGRARHRFPDRQIKSLEYINNHYSTAISVTQLAEMENLSPSYYRTLFKKLTGTTPAIYIARKRVNAACLYFQQCNMSVKEVAHAVGYDDSLYFSKVFKKITGTSPKSYKLSQKTERQ